MLDKWIYLFLMFSLSIGLSGCFRRSDPPVPDPAIWGVAWNAERVKRSICIVEPTMTLEHSVRCLTWSVNPPVLPGYDCHMVVFDDNSVHWHEVDRYATGRRFPVPNSGGVFEGNTAPEELVIIFDLDREKKGENPWYCRWRKDTYVDQELTLSEAEDLLKTWGVKRLNY